MTAQASAESHKPSDPFAHTYSIVARDPETGEMGVAVESHWFSVGSVVSWGEGGVGVVATQSFANPAFGPQGLARLKAGEKPELALDAMLEADEGKPFRQVALLSSNGVAVHTGSSCIDYAGHVSGENYSCQANMMLNETVPAAMSRAFLASEGKPLAERLLMALKAAEEAGGDIRGRQSAAMLVVSGNQSDRPWEEVLLDLRVDDHLEPLVELERLYHTHRAYVHMTAGDVAMEHGDFAAALDSYESARQLLPEHIEVRYWTAVTMVNGGKLEEALPIFGEVFAAEPNWRMLTSRIVDNGLLKVNEKQLDEILARGR
jgi:uncharacterized Ntn-hydrolase superfamily protein